MRKIVFEVLDVFFFTRRLQEVVDLPAHDLLRLPILFEGASNLRRGPGKNICVGIALLAEAACLFYQSANIFQVTFGKLLFPLLGALVGCEYLGLSRAYSSQHSLLRLCPEPCSGHAA